MKEGRELVAPYISELIEDRKFSVSKEPPQVNWVLSKKNDDGRFSKVASRGDLMVIYGHEKVRKSTFISAIIASAYVSDEDTTLGFHLDLGDDEEIIHMDTEMSMYNYYDRQTILNRMCGFDTNEDIPYYSSYSTRPYTFYERLDQVEYLLNHSDNPAVLILDQIVDFVSNLNDINQTNNLIDRLFEWQDKYNLLIIVTIHKNSDDSMRGMIGSVLKQKLETSFNLTLDAETGFTHVKNFPSRNPMSDNFIFTQDKKSSFPIIIKENEFV